MPPSAATSQYPAPVGVAAIPTSGRLSGPVVPYSFVSPVRNIRPSRATTHNPNADGVADAPTMGNGNWRGGRYAQGGAAPFGSKVPLLAIIQYPLPEARCGPTR